MYSYGIFDTKRKPRKGQGSIQNGDSGGQREWCNPSLARLIEDENPAMAIELFERSLAVKYDSDVVNELGIVRAVRILTWLRTPSSRRWRPGTSCAPRAIWPIFIPDDPNRQRICIYLYWNKRAGRLPSPLLFGAGERPGAGGQPVEQSHRESRRQRAAGASSSRSLPWPTRKQL